MKVITHDDIMRLDIDPITCYEWVSDAILNKKDVLLPPKISMKPKDGMFCNVMPCIITDGSMENTGGVKIVTRYPTRVPSLDSKILLIDSDNGEYQAIMDANWITAMRTGAVAAHSILLLAKKDFNIISLIGLGNTARATMLVLLSLLPDRKFNIRLMRYKNQEIDFVDRFKTYSNLTFEYVETEEALVRGADVVISCITYAPNDICPDDCFDEGILVVPVHTLGFTNCDLFFDKIYADDYGHVKNFKYFDKFQYFAEVSDIVNMKVKGRENDRERILAYNVGLSMHDIYFAKKIYNIIMARSIELYEIDMCEPCNKFWV